jgi:hypothetical protein
MLSSRPSIRALFCFAVALVAAGIADPLLEAASNAGLFGHGSFTDHSNLDVMPVLATGLTLALLWTLVRIGQLVRSEPPRSSWLRAWSGALDSKTLVRLMPAILATQFCALFTMETLEQIAVAGHPLWGLVWLGAPALIAIVVHITFGIALTVLLARSLHAFASTLVEVVRLIRTWIASLAAGGAGRRTSLTQVAVPRRAPPVRCRIGERAPPFLSA